MSCVSEAPRNLNFIVQLPLHRSHTWQVDVRGHESKSHHLVLFFSIFAPGGTLSSTSGDSYIELRLVLLIICY